MHEAVWEGPPTCCSTGAGSLASLSFRLPFVLLCCFYCPFRPPSFSPFPSCLLHLLSCFSFIFPLLSSPFPLFPPFLWLPRVCLHVFLLLYRRHHSSLVPFKLGSIQASHSRFILKSRCCQGFAEPVAPVQTLELPVDSLKLAGIKRRT